MTEKKARKNNRNIIIGAIIGIVALIVVVTLIIIMVARGNRLDESFFVSDGSKYVATLDGNDYGFSDEEDIVPVKVYVVYFVSGDKVTDMKSYYEFADEVSAKKAFDIAKQGDSEELDSYELNGKYIVLTAEPIQYEGMTAEDAKAQIEFIEISNGMSSGSDIEVVTDDEFEEEELDEEGEVIDDGEVTEVTEGESETAEE